jgi:zinc protease
MMSIFLLATMAFSQPFDTNATVHKLDNGLTVILEESHRTDTVALHITYGVGAYDEEPGTFGCAHLFEHLMFEGSANVPTNMFDTWLTEAGGSNNAWTSNDETAYHMTFPSGGLERALFLESDRLAFLDAGLNAENVKNQQEVVLQERATGYAEPHGRDWDALFRLAFPKEHPYRHPVIGTVADINAFETQKVLEFWKRHYRPSNATLALVGHFDSEQALEKITHWFSDVPNRGPAGMRPVTPEELKWEYLHGYIEDAVEDDSLALVYRAPKLHATDEAAVEILSYILSYGQGTRLDDPLYFDSNLTSDIGTYYFAGDIDGLFVIYATPYTKPLSVITKHIDKHLAALRSNPPTADEVNRAQQAIRSELLEQMEAPEDRANVLVDCYRYTKNANCQKSEWERYAAVTPEDVLRVAQKYLLDSQRTTLSVVPKGSAKRALPGAVLVELP